MCGPLYLAILNCHVLWLFFVSPNNNVKRKTLNFHFSPTILTFTTNSLSFVSFLPFFLPLFSCIQCPPHQNYASADPGSVQDYHFLLFDSKKEMPISKSFDFFGGKICCLMVLFLSESVVSDEQFSVWFFWGNELLVGLRLTESCEFWHFLWWKFLGRLCEGVLC